MRSSSALSSGLFGLLICISTSVPAAAQAPPSIQLFMPDGSPPGREIRFRLETDQGRTEDFFTDSRGRFLFTRKEGLNANAGYTITVEGDGQSYATTTVTFKYYQSTVFYVPVFLKPLERQPLAPGGVVDVSTLTHEASGGDQEKPWNRKPHTEWSEKETLRLLNDSPWGQTQTVVDTSGSFAAGRRADSGQSRVADTPELLFRIRFVSAKPMRQAISRFVALQQPGRMAEDLAARLAAFAEADFPDYIVVQVACESASANSLHREASALLAKLTTGEIQNTTYLLAQDGRRLFLREYQVPGKDGLGARFIFERKTDGKPFLSEDSGEVRFYSELGNGLKVAGNPVFLNMPFRVPEMVYKGKLEY
ncbi:MAG: hypothetical protein FJW35_17035 [Acidobacteria bacterium]|nr:hypothetical protein [Acidobacteriota bacterium]